MNLTVLFEQIKLQRKIYNYLLYKLFISDSRVGVDLMKCGISIVLRGKFSMVGVVPFPISIRNLLNLSLEFISLMFCDNFNFLNCGHIYVVFIVDSMIVDFFIFFNIGRHCLKSPPMFI